MDISTLKDNFKAEFGVEAAVFRAPGRVNIIGEHTDYNEGLVLPFPISQAIYFAVSLRDDEEFHIHALDLNVQAVIHKNELKTGGDWTRYFIAALKVLNIDNYQYSGLNILASGDIPFGAGISSSSALTCGFLYAISEMNNLNISKRDIVFLSSRAENSTGVNGGKMDQFSICLGIKNKAIFLDCRGYTHQLVENNIPGAQWFLLNTNVEHNLAHTEYNDRRKDCEDGLKAIKKRHKKIGSVRELNHDILDECVDLLSKTQYDRLSHVVSENERVLAMLGALKSNDLQKIGALLSESHASLESLYEVSCEELDFVVAHLSNQTFCYGSRMMGGGFGGSVIALLSQEGVKLEKLKQKYKESFDLELQLIPVQSDNGIERIY